MNFAKTQLADPAVELSEQPSVDVSWKAAHVADVLTDELPARLNGAAVGGAWREIASPANDGASGLDAVTCSHRREHLSPLFAARDFITGHDFKVALCGQCGLSVTTPQPGLREIANYYPCGYYGALADRRFPRIVETLQEALYGQRVRQVEAVVGKTPGRVLDVGCGRGWLLQEFRRRGWEVQGTELSEGAAGYAREVLKLPVATGNLEMIGFPANHFDVITLWHVLEHVADPKALLAEANRILKPGGVLLVSVPNFGGAEARLFRNRWFHLDVPRHVTHFTKSALQSVLGETGFQDHRWSGFAHEYDTFSFVQSALNACGLRHNLLYDLLRGKGAKVIAERRAPGWQVVATMLLGTVFGLVSVPATLLAGLFGQGGTMTVLAVKGTDVPASKRIWQMVTGGLSRRWAVAQMTNDQM